MAHANVAEPIEHAFIGENMASSYELFDNRLVHEIPSVHGALAIIAAASE
jgi:hypothetical protein